MGETRLTTPASPPSIARGSSLPARDRRPLPEWYRENGTPATPLSSQPLPVYTLWVSLHGGNGKWAQQRAIESWEQQLQERSRKHREMADCKAGRLAREAEVERLKKDEETYR